MGEMLTYIFSSLRSSEKRLDVVTRAVSKQRSFNKQLTILCCYDNRKPGCYENRAEGPGIAYQKVGKGNRGT